MPVLPRPTVQVNENSGHLARTARPAQPTAGPNAAATSPQAGFIRSLLADRDTSDADRALRGLIDAFQAETLTKGNASELITLLKGLPDKTRMSDWQRPVQTELPVPAASRPEPVGVGYYYLGGSFYQVKISRTTDRPYAMMWDGARWDYEAARGVYRQLRPEMELTAEQAKEFGDTYHACIYCHQALTDQRSIDAGYGPTCAENNSLPWG